MVCECCPRGKLLETELANVHQVMVQAASTGVDEIMGSEPTKTFAFLGKPIVLRLSPFSAK